MPELPEVEIARRNLARWLEGREVVRAEPERTRIFRGGHPERFAALRGRLVEARRRGKYLMLRFSDGTGLLAHLGMTGKFVRRPSGAQEPYSRARLVLDDGEVIHFRDPRMFGRMEAVDADRLPELPAVKGLGVDPLADGLTWKALRDAVGSSRQDLKVALMDQGRIAGLGNIHAAEALYRAGLHPARKPGSLGDEDWKRLAAAILKGIDFALREQESEEIEYVEEPGAENPFLIYGRAGEECRKCGTTVRSFTQGGRTTHYCPTCQPRTVRTPRKRAR
jgi:formamidopyrimidine-DNA glycosylase